jgi:hypothetical protein
MSRINVQIEGLGALDSALAEVRSAVQEGTEAGSGATAELIGQEWQASAPVDEGEYRDSIEVEGGEVFATARHAPFVWFGTSTHAAQPSDDAIERGRSEAPQIIGDEIKGRLP